jgi:hypothetical protein
MVEHRAENPPARERAERHAALPVERRGRFDQADIAGRLQLFDVDVRRQSRPLAQPVRNLRDEPEMFGYECVASLACDAATPFGGLQRPTARSVRSASRPRPASRRASSIVRSVRATFSASASSTSSAATEMTVMPAMRSSCAYGSQHVSAQSIGVTPNDPQFAHRASELSR